MFRNSHVSEIGIKADTHLQQKGPRSRLCPRRRCSSGVGKLPPIQTQGTLQNRHVKSQARESHWKKIQIGCAKNTNKETQHAFFKTDLNELCVPRDDWVKKGLWATQSCPLSDPYILRLDQRGILRYIYLFIVCCSVSTTLRVNQWCFEPSSLPHWLPVSVIMIKLLLWYIPWHVLPARDARRKFERGKYKADNNYFLL